MKKQIKEKIVTVEDSRGFPIDMLRYDRATPHSEADSYAIEGSGIRVVMVRMENSPTIPRWHSFGWRVVKIG